MADEKPCLFCAIAGGKVPAKKIYEDSDSIAFLDINPRTKGMSIVIPKKHFAFMHDDFMSSLKTFQAAESVSHMVMQSLGSKYVEMAVIASPEVPHFHFRLYPIYSDERPIAEAAPMKMGGDDLDKIAGSISSARPEIFSQVKDEKKPVEEERPEEDSRYIKKQIDRA